MQGEAPPPRPKLPKNEGNGQKFPVSPQDKGKSLEADGKLPPVQQEKGKVESSGHEAKYGGENHSTKLSNEIKEEDSMVGKGSGERSGKPEVFGGESGAGSHWDGGGGGGEKPLLGNAEKEGIGKHEGPRDGPSHGGGDTKQENPLGEDPKEPPPRDGFGEAKFGGVTLSDSKDGGGGENQQNQHGDGQAKHNFKNNGQQQPEAAGRPNSNLGHPEERPGTGSSSSSHGFKDGSGGSGPLSKDGGGRHKFQDSNMRDGGSDQGLVRHSGEGGGGGGGKGGKKKDASSSGQVSFAV